MTEYVGQRTHRDVDLPDCPECEAETTRVMGQGPQGDQRPVTPWCVKCGWRGDAIEDYFKTDGVVDITSLDGVADGVLESGNIIRGDEWIDHLPDEKVTHAEPPTAADKLAHALDDP